MKIWAGCFALLVLLAGCAREESPQADVWENYDVRYPLTADARVPVYNQFIDNDQYYAAPDCSMMDSPGCISD